MNRSLLGFLLFVAALLVAAGFGVWWLGPPVVELALDDSRRSEPYFLLNLTDADPGGEYVPGLAALARAEDGEMLWRGSLTRLLDGRVADEWADAVLFRFAAGGDVVQMITSPEYRALVEGRRILLLGSAVPLTGLDERGNLILGLLEARDGGRPMQDAVAVLTASLAGFDGTLLWDGPVDRLAGDAVWDRLLLVSFATEEGAKAWFRDPAVETERALGRTAFDRQAWLLLRSGYAE